MGHWVLFILKPYLKWQKVFCSLQTVLTNTSNVILHLYQLYHAGFKKKIQVYVQLILIYFEIIFPCVLKYHTIIHYMTIIDTHVLYR